MMNLIKSLALLVICITASAVTLKRKKEIQNEANPEMSFALLVELLVFLVCAAFLAVNIAVLR